MEITSWELYWLTRLDGLKECSMVVVCIALIIMVVYAIARGIDDDTPKMSKKCLNSLIFMVVIPAFVLLFVPSTKQMATIVILPVLVNSEALQKDIPAEVKEVYGLYKQYLRQQITGAPEPGKKVKRE